MKRIAIFCVSYGSYQELYRYLDSICQAAAETHRDIETDVFIADNTDQQPQEITYDSPHIRLKVFPFHQNIGYFGAVRKMMQEVSPLPYDYTIISNVDMYLHPDTLTALGQYVCEETTGWIAPAILSCATGQDMNPQSVNRYTLTRLRLARLSYRLPFVHELYAKTIHKQRHKTHHPAGPIYTGHGSFFILTKAYFQQCGIVNYPVFLYDEELYVAEECRLHGLKVMYDPSIAVSDIGKVSTGRARKKSYRQWNVEGITYIINIYY